MKSLTKAIAAAWLLAAAVPAYSQPAASKPDVEALHQAVLKACGADQERFCHGKTGREGHDCMAASLPKASKTCQEAIARMPQTPPPQQSAAGPANAPPR